ncbi:MAG: SMI1/KNR4 family protein [Parachlamydiaceae bacterium]
MDKHIMEFYRKHPDGQSQGHFHQVIDLNDTDSYSWEAVEKMVPHLCKGWYELSQLSNNDRIEFTKSYWLSKLIFTPTLGNSIDKFFDAVDEIAVFLVQKKFDDPFEAHMIYSLKHGQGFYKGLCGAREEEIERLKREFTGWIFPKDYLGFLEVHNGFCKTTDSGIFSTKEMPDRYSQFQSLVTEKDGILTTLDELPVDPGSLAPFYASFNMPFFQCFWSEWYPEEEMGNVYYSGVTNTISILASKKGSVENMAFSTFTDWLMFYLETFE